MTLVEIGGEKIETDLPADAVADLQTPKEPDPAPEPAKVEEPVTPTVEPKTEEPVPPPAPPVPPVVREPKKATPFQTLLDKKHDAEQERDQALADKAELEAKLAELSKQPASVATTEDIQSLATELGADPAVLQKIVDAARKGFTPEVPKEMQDIIAQHREQVQMQAEETAFKGDLGRLQTTLGDDQLKDPAVQDKLKELAYSDKLAPDGEAFYKKPLYELFMKYVKPEVEPGRTSAEPTRGGSKAGDKVMDFQEIFDRDDPKDIEAMDDKTFKAYNKWMTEKQGEVRVTRNH